jgi:tartrate dehydratase beta subunit/fumarate hydratase class I family protein
VEEPRTKRYSTFIFAGILPRKDVAAVIVSADPTTCKRKASATREVTPTSTFSTLSLGRCKTGNRVAAEDLTIGVEKRALKSVYKFLSLVSCFEIPQGI